MKKKVIVHVHKTNDGFREADQMLAKIEELIPRIQEKANVLANHAMRAKGTEAIKSEQQLADILAKLQRV